MRDGALSWAGFFFFILVHLAFAVFSAIAPPLSEDGVSTEGLAYAHTGWMPVIDLFKLSNGDGGYKFVAICYAVGTHHLSLFGFPSLMCPSLGLIFAVCPTPTWWCYAGGTEPSSLGHGLEITLLLSTKLPPSVEHVLHKHDRSSDRALMEGLMHL